MFSLSAIEKLAEKLTAQGTKEMVEHLERIEQLLEHLVDHTEASAWADSGSRGRQAHADRFHP